MKNWLKFKIPIVFGAVMLLWITIINGQPFFHPDTTNYIRAPDAAIVKVLGSRFFTSWTGAEVRKFLGAGPTTWNRNSVAEATELDVQSAEEGYQSQSRHTNSVRDRVILAGMSAYYGTLLYVS